MKICDAISQIDRLKHNTYSVADKVSWLSRLDAMAKRLIIDTHEGGEEVPFSGYDDTTDTGTEMLIPAPFDEVYIRWLEAQIDYANAEYDSYNNSIQMFQTAYDQYEAWYNRTHMPIGKPVVYF